MPGRTMFAAALLLLPLGVACAPSVAAARTPYDGAWSVSIITDAGTCDRAYRYALRIENGRIYYDDPSFDVSGRVDAHGRVTVVVRHGDSQAVGSGRMSRDAGEGVWRGRSPGSQCSGHWEAERRD